MLPVCFRIRQEFVNDLLLITVYLLLYRWPLLVITTKSKHTVVEYAFPNVLFHFTYFKEGSSSLAYLHHRCDGMCLNGGTGRRSF